MGRTAESIEFSPHAQRGQSLVETALALPILAVVLVGAVDAARVLLGGVVMQTAVLAGAQYGALSPASASDTAGIASAVRNEVRLPQAGATNPTVTSATSKDANGELRVSVSATFTMTTLFNYPGLPSTVSIARAATQQVRR